MFEPGFELDFPEKALSRNGHGKLRLEHFDGDIAVVPEVSSQEDERHASAADLALNGVVVGQRAA
jgi:hypothetical protein